MAKSTKKFNYDGMHFQSESELDFYKKLIEYKSNGLIKDFKCNIEIVLLKGGWYNFKGKRQDDITHIIDYMIVTNQGEKIWLDTKGGGVKNHQMDAKIKHKWTCFLHPDVKYYYISRLPKYMGKKWVESTSGSDFFTKIRKKYIAEFPDEYKKHHTDPTKKQFYPHDWREYFDFESVNGLFYVFKKAYTKREREKMKRDKLKREKENKNG